MIGWTCCPSLDGLFASIGWRMTVELITRFTLAQEQSMLLRTRTLKLVFLLKGPRRSISSVQWFVLRLIIHYPGTNSFSLGRHRWQDSVSSTHCSPRICISHGGSDVQLFCSFHNYDLFFNQTYISEPYWYRFGYKPCWATVVILWSSIIVRSVSS